MTSLLATLLGIVRACYDDVETTKDVSATARAALASDALDALHALLFGGGFGAASASSSSSPSDAARIRARFRKCLPIDAVLEFVDLGRSLDVWASAKASTTPGATRATTTARRSTRIPPRRAGEAPAPSYLSTKDRVHPSSEGAARRRVRESHVRLARTIGSVAGRDGGCLRGADARLRAFRAAFDSKGGDGGEGIWPSSLPAAHHALISSLVLGAAADVDGDGGREEEGSSGADLRFLCDAFLRGMEGLLGEAGEGAAEEEGDDDVPLSLRDARLFAATVARLPREGRKRTLSRCVDALRGRLSNESADGASMDGGRSRVLARAVVLTAALVDVVSSPGLRPALDAALAKTDYARSRVGGGGGTDRRRPNAETLRTDDYQGLLEDWTSPCVPCEGVAATETMDPAEHEKLREVLAKAVEEGLRTAARDGCRLLFSAWNAYGKLPTWTSRSVEEGPKALSENTSSAAGAEADYVGRILKLREDMARIHDLVRGAPRPTTLLLRVEQSKRAGSRPRPSRALPSALIAAERALASLTTEAEEGARDLARGGAAAAPSSLAAFAYREALPLYLSMLVSLHASPGPSDAGGSARRFPAAGGRGPPSGLPGEAARGAGGTGVAAAYRNPSEDSDPDDRDEEEEDDEDDFPGPPADDGAASRSSTALARDGRLASGAAPRFPDRMDEGCALTEGLSSAAAVEAAGRSLRALSKFGAAALRRYLDALRDALDVLGGAAPGLREQGASLSSTALKLYFFAKPAPSERSPFLSHVSTFCRVGDEKTFGLLLDSIDPGRHRMGGKALSSTTAQRIRGAGRVDASGEAVPPGELRVGGQWELLLAEALRGSSLTVSRAEIIEAAGNDADVADRLSAALSTAIRWRRVLYSVVNAAVPAAALLRFGARGGGGRSGARSALRRDRRFPGSSAFGDSDDREYGVAASPPWPRDEEAGTAARGALSFLSCVYSHASNDAEMRDVARAAAERLLEGGWARFARLAELQRCRIFCEAVDGVVRALAVEDDVAEARRTAAHALLEASLARFAKERNTTGPPAVGFGDRLDPEKRTTLLAFLGARNLAVGRWIGGPAHADLADMLTQCDEITPFAEEEYSWSSMPRLFARTLLTLMCEGKVQLLLRARAFVAEILDDLMNAEAEFAKGRTADCDSVRSFVALSLDDLPEDDVLLLVENIASSATDMGDNRIKEENTLSEKTVRVISHVACSRRLRGSADGSKAKVILRELSGRIDRWAGRPDRRHVVKLLCLLASRYDALDEAGRSIVELLRPERIPSDIALLQPYTDTARTFFECVASLNILVNQTPTTAAMESTAGTLRLPSSKEAFIRLKNGDEVPKTCTYVETGEGFTEQHWYNCYTCGLLWDKGCCTLCARVCHKGHDIGYSRKSSFFCDCGHENRGPALEHPCKCLSPLSESLLREAYGDESDDDDLEANGDSENDNVFLEMAARNFRVETSVSLQKLIEEANSSGWGESIFLLFNRCYRNSPGPGATDFSTLLSAAAQQPAGGGSPNLHMRSARPLELQRLSNVSMEPIRAAKASALQTRMISSTSSLKPHQKSLSAQAIAADSRGRLFVAESSSVLFCNGIPPVNVLHMENSPASHLSRSQLNILGGDSVKFLIHGMSVSPENDRHLLIWGGSNACVAILSKALDSFERVIELKLSIDSEEHLVKCDWMPQSELHVVAVCGTVVHCFDLKRLESNGTSCSTSPTTNYALAYEDVTIRSATMIGSLSTEDGSVDTKLALLLDTGRMYFISLTIDEEGNLEDHGESYIEIGSGISFPSTGLRRCGAEVLPKGSSTSFGEGSCLHYLQQSNCLLYQCVSSCCVAMLLDDDGAVCGSFELLPNVIAPEDIGSHYGVAGPYTHFQSLGIVSRGAEAFYRISCVGRSTRSGQPRALLLEFNERSVFVTELSWPTNCSSGLGFISSYSFVGSCAFSVPYLVDAGKDRSVKGETQICERAVMALLSSSGSLLWFGEKLDDASEDEGWLGQEKVELGVFEKMINVSELDGLVLGGDFVKGSDPKSLSMHERMGIIKKKLSLNNTDCAIAPSRDGCCLTARLEMEDFHPKSTTDSKSEAGADRPAIVAVRALVGSMPDLIPREIAIMGRSIKMKNHVKRWYDFCLTDEEILLAMRNGFVSIWISPSQESSSTPIIDSIEIYARSRADLGFLKSYQVENAGAENHSSSTLCFHQEPSVELLVSCLESMVALQSICSSDQSLGQSKMESLSAESKETMSHIIQQTSLDSGEKGTLRALTVDLLNVAMPDASERTSFVDEATLRGLMATMRGLRNHLQTEFASVDIVTPKQEAMIECATDTLCLILTLTKQCARTGGNYRRIIADMVADKTCEVSLALEGKKILDFCQYLHLHGLNLKLARSVQLVSELMLMEMAACSDSGELMFGSFDILSEYLLCDSREIVCSACCAVSNALGQSGGSSSSSKISSTPSHNKELALVSYQCDSCHAFPILDQRYTLGGDEMDIDLCTRCYDAGMTYARRHDPDEPVVINERTLCVENEDMTCGKIESLRPVPIAQRLVENVKKAGLLTGQGASRSTSSKSHRQSVDKSSVKQGEGIEPMKTEGFRSRLFTMLLDMMIRSLSATEGKETPLPSSHVLQLVINIVLDSDLHLKYSRAKEMARAIFHNITSLAKLCQSDGGFAKHSSKLVVCMRTLSSLILQKREIGRDMAQAATHDEERDGAQHHHKDKTDPRFVCDVHGVPAVRRRCSHGVHKDRRFYVCGLERKHRCNYFKWSTDVPESPHEDQLEAIGGDNVQDVFELVQTQIRNLFSEHQLQETFIELVSSQFEKHEAATSPGDAIGTVESASKNVFPSLREDKDIKEDINDGVFRTLEKFGRSKPRASAHIDGDDASLSTSSVADGTGASFLCAALDIFSLLAPKSKPSSSTANASSWPSEWFSVLCEIISTSSSHVLRYLAKSMLQRLCGGRQDVYHRVRDHYVFGFSFRKLLQQSYDILDSALVVREQARQCGSKWREDEVTFETLPASGLLGVEDLISEDCFTVTTDESIAAVLDELLSAAGRQKTWSYFCGLPEMAISGRKGTSASMGGGVMLEMLEQIYRRSPSLSLLWLSSCLRGKNQVKAFSLLDIALDGTNFSASEAEGLRHDGVEKEVDTPIGGHHAGDSHPADPLQCFTADDLLAFIKQFVLNGRSKELRAVSSSVAKKLATKLPPSSKNRLCHCLIGGPFQGLGSLGNASNEFIDLLNFLVHNFASDLDDGIVREISSSVKFAFVVLMTEFNQNHGQFQGLFGKQEGELGSLSCNLSDCAGCHRRIPPKKASKSSGKKSDSSNQSSTAKDSDGNKSTFLPEQVRSYQRSRLEDLASNHVSSEFSSFTQLKFRLALSQVHLTVSDPRGRLVKTIGVYFSPRQVSDASILKTESYAHYWQRCGTLSLARGASESNCKLKTPVIAANLKFTYEEFYEKASNKRAPDGSFILYCPRCTRQVHNAHGVCGNCGEVAFQCRKCRHINYDRLDAFLCVECGYCTAGGFDYELTAGIALNAIAILDDMGLQRTMTMLGLAEKKVSDMRNSLKKKVTAALQQQRKLQGVEENLDDLVYYGKSFQRALLGDMPKFDGFEDDDESSKKPSSSSRPRGSSSSLSERASTTSSRARSLLSLARSLRTDGGDGLGSRGDFLRQALLSAGAGSSGTSAYDALDDDLLQALASSSGTSSGSDPLSRLVANIHARARDEGRGSQPGASGAGSGGGGRSDPGATRKHDKSKHSPSEERYRLYTQMREAERECYELNRRINAWNRLNKDRLAGVSPPSQFTARPHAFTPSTCSVCSPQMTHQVLLLLHTIYEANISQSEHTISSELIKSLLTESEHLSPKLKDLKRQVLITLASTSEAASEIILPELRLRLDAVKDVTCAEILGKLVQLDFPSVEDYIELAMTTLSNM